MGCDWYQIFLYKVIYKDPQGNICSKTIEYDRSAVYSVHYDSDEEEYGEALDREMSTFIQTPQKVLYNDGEWKISSKIAEIKHILRKINFDDIVSITRVYNAMERL